MAPIKLNTWKKKDKLISSEVKPQTPLVNWKMKEWGGVDEPIEEEVQHLGDDEERVPVDVSIILLLDSVFILVNLLLVAGVCVATLPKLDGGPAF